ncbi:hypothetical protein GH714_043722 [Hevea brasiliensis]|uniref:Uncharacterized protein n=1 Tax=Hevea brasiliensis TaxID=3981 RepID=A0A6A6K439_HEVBR|nr:hypothetical protein GH714_043722 [Hevea brasiliensis]
MKNNNFSAMTGVDFLDRSFLSVLDISNNKVSGPFPRQLCNMSSLEFLDLSENRLYGPMPSCFNASSLHFLFLQKNSLNGSIPHVLLRSPNLVALDLTDNSFSGNIPSWISQLSQLRVLLLGGNELHGSIPNQLCESRNNDGSQLFYSMDEVFAFISAPRDGSIYWDLPDRSWNSLEDVEVEFAMKYRYNSYRGDTINLMAGIDLSCNELSGRIPPEIGDLHGIRSLNLSNNHLTGSIPVSFSNLRNLESLDLGNNSLNGEIPNELVVLTFLETFNVSYNNFSGRVLDKEQFGTFDENSYKGTLYSIGSPYMVEATGYTTECLVQPFLPMGRDLCGTFIAVHEANLSRNKLDAARILLIIDHQGHIDKIMAIDIDNTRYHIKAFEESCSELYKQFHKIAIGDSDYDDVNFSDGSAHDDMNFYDELAAQEDEVGNHIGTGEQSQSDDNLGGNILESSSQCNSHPINEIVQIGEVDVVDAGLEERVALSPSDGRRNSPFVNSQSEDPLASLPVFGPNTENIVLSPLNLGNLEICGLNLLWILQKQNTERK